MIEKHSAGDINNPHNYKIYTAITFAFRKDRLQYLFCVLRSLSSFPVGYMSINIFTDTNDPELINIITNYSKFIFDSRKRLYLVPTVDLEHPLELTWAHKPTMMQAYLSSEHEYTHFLYLEEDILFTFENFSYFVEYNKHLGPHGLIPSFLRVEVNCQDGSICLTDVSLPIRITNRPFVTAGPYYFINSDVPYTAMFLMDRTQFKEYISTSSFDRVLSANVSTWFTAERAAMGLTWENVPSGFTSRNVLPIDLMISAPSKLCHIHHLPNNYANNNHLEGAPGSIRLVKGFYLGKREIVDPPALLPNEVTSVPHDPPRSETQSFRHDPLEANPDALEIKPMQGENNSFEQTPMEESINPIDQQALTYDTKVLTSEEGIGKIR